MVMAVDAPRGELGLAVAAALSPEEVLARLGSGQTGLSSEDAAERLRKFGPNALGTHRVRATAVLLRQVRNPILVLLLGAALVSGLTGGGTNAHIIAMIVALSIGLGFFNEYRAGVAMAALRAQIRHEAGVRRDGRACRVPVTDLVPGDTVSLRIGDLVPADLRLLTVRADRRGPGRATGPDRVRGRAVAFLPVPVRGGGCADGVHLRRQRGLVSVHTARRSTPTRRSRAGQTNAPEQEQHRSRGGQHARPYGQRMP